MGGICLFPSFLKIVRSIACDLTPVSYQEVKLLGFTQWFQLGSYIRSIRCVPRRGEGGASMVTLFLSLFCDKGCGLIPQRSEIYCRDVMLGMGRKTNIIAPSYILSPIPNAHQHFTTISSSCRFPPSPIQFDLQHHLDPPPHLPASPPSRPD